MTNARNLANLLGGSTTISIESLGDDIPVTEKFTQASELPAGANIGEQAFVEETNRLYIWNGSGWYNIALINTTPTWDSNGQPNASYILDADSPQTATTITLAASDPEETPVSYNYVTGGQMDSIATISQDSSVFTITPKTSVQAPGGGTGSITFRATDGINILPQVSSFTLNFISIVENSRYTTLLATATGTSDNNNITDSSTNNHSITVNGDAHAGTFSPYRSGGYSLKFNGTANNYIRVPWWQRANLGTNDFTVECFVYPTNNFSVICDLLPGSAGLFRLATWTGGNLALDINKQGVGAFDIRTTGGNINYNAWNHVAVCRSGTSLKLYSNGSLIHTETGGDWDYGTGDAYSNIGRWNTSGDVLNGYISNFRVKNSALYTGNTYNVPTEDFTSDAGTTLLVGAGALVDNVTPYGVEMYGVVTSEPFSPYDYDEYSATDHGGSVYFDGNGDAIEIPQSTNVGAFGTNDFTVQLWYYTEANGNTDYLIDFRQYGANGDYLSIFKNGSNKIVVAEGGSNRITGTKDISVGQWFFITVHRDSGSLKLFVNGEQDGNTYSDSTNYVSGSSNNFIIGKNNGSAGYSMEGYLSDIKVTHGSALDGTTVPTAPLSSSGAALHIKGTDASIIDKAQGANLKLVGNTTGSTTQAKFGGSKSMYFDGTGDYITSSSSSSVLGNGDFTVELWLYASSIVSGYRCICSQGSTGTSFRMFVNDTSIQVWSGASRYINYNNSTTANTWYHIAYSHSSSGYSLYVDGSLAFNHGTVPSLDRTLTSINIGGGDGSPGIIDGYIQDFRITKGLARYTANFTPPTASLEG